MRHGSGMRVPFLLLALLLATGGCSGNGGLRADPQDSQARPEGAPQPPELQEAPPEGGVPTIQATDEAARKAAEEALKTYSVQDQERIAQSNMLYLRALSNRDRGALEKAKEDAAQAVEIWPANKEARKLLDEIRQVTVGGQERSGGRGLAERERQEMAVKIEQTLIEITNHIRQGERFHVAQLFDEAVKEFEEAEFKIRNIPLEVPALKDLLPKVSDYLAKTRDARTRARDSLDKLKQREAIAEVEAHEQARRREILEKIAHLLEMAYLLFDQRRFEKCIQMCDEILLIDPHYSVALELKEDAQKSQHREEYYEYLRAKIDNWKRLQDSDEQGVIPYSKTVQFPSAEEWKQISERITQMTIRGQDTEMDEDPEILAIHRKLDTMKLDIQFDGAKLEDILAYIRDYAGLNIVLDAAVRDQGGTEKEIQFKVRDLILKNVLKHLLGQYGLDYQVTEEKVVLITTPEKAGGKAVLELHDIRDILVKISDHAGPKVELPTAAGGGGLSGASFALPEEKESTVGQDQILELIRENIAPGSWEGEHTIDMTPNQQLLVSHTAKVQLEVREFLQKIRSFTGTMVSITARFISAYDDFLSDLGVDIIDRPVGGAPPAGYDISGLGTTDVDERAGGTEVGPGFLTNESARAESYDLRAQTFHSFLTMDPLTNQRIDPFSNRQNNQGGVGMTYRFLGEQSLQTVLRAVQKNSKATVLQAPRLTVFNAQRSHIMSILQRNYIRDLDPQVGVATGSYDPVLAVLSEGVVLDVRPIVSNDRKYVTMELRPTLAEIEVVRNVNIRQLGLGLGPPPTRAGWYIQLPLMVLQKTETTVAVPDRGTLMISGFKDIRMVSAESSVPFLRNIPVVNFFFSRKGQTDERRRLMILVTPEIIDLMEH